MLPGHYNLQIMTVVVRAAANQLIHCRGNEYSAPTRQLKFQLVSVLMQVLGLTCQTCLNIIHMPLEIRCKYHTLYELACFKV